jgi:hypothetical protein
MTWSGFSSANASRKRRPAEAFGCDMLFLPDFCLVCFAQ